MKAKPRFQKHLVVSAVIFATSLIAIIFAAAYYVIRSMDSKLEEEVAYLSEAVGQQISDQIEVLRSRNGGVSVLENGSSRQTLKTYMDGQLQAIPPLYYLILENLSGAVVAESFKENIRPDEVNVLLRGTLKPRQPRSQQLELSGLADAHLRIRDYGTPVRLDARSMGILRLGVSNDYLDERVAALRKEIYHRAISLSAVAVAIFSTIFFYVRWLVKRAQGLEAQAQEADRLAYLGTLAGGLAHEIRNPLSAMNLNIQMMEEDFRDLWPKGSEAPRLFESTKKEIKRLERLATSFLTYARPLHIEGHPVNLKELLNGVNREFKPQLDALGIGFSVDLDAVHEARIHGDKDLLKQALLNLLLNAKDAVLEAPSAAKTIEVILDHDRHGFQIQIRDNGIGITPDQAKSIFEMFYSNKRGGTGLGLPIARQIIEHHGGRIEFHSQPGETTTFRVFLPNRPSQNQ